MTRKHKAKYEAFKRCINEPTTKALCDAHRRAIKRMITAEDALTRVEQRKFRGISIHVMEVIKPGLGVLRPSRKDKLCTTYVQKNAKSHADIDEICNAYIKLARKEGKWGWYHNPTRGRLDAHGVFHAIDAPCCPKEGRIVVQQAVNRLPFDSRSLTEYRLRVKGLHQLLDQELAAIDAANEASGWTKAQAKWDTAEKLAERTWDNILQRVKCGSLDDIQQICRYQANLLKAAFRRDLASGDDRLSYDEFMRLQTARAQDIGWVIARRRLVVRHPEKVTPFMRKAA